MRCGRIVGIVEIEAMQAVDTVVQLVKCPFELLVLVSFATQAMINGCRRAHRLFSIWHSLVVTCLIFIIEAVFLTQLSSH